MHNSNSIRPWYQPFPARFAVLAGLVLLVTGATSNSVLAASSSGGFASVIIKDKTKEEIIVATAQVFAADGYQSGKSASGQMVFDKEASRGTSIARDGIAATQSGARTIHRVRVEVIPLEDGSHRLQGKAYMLTGGSDPFFQDEVPLAKARKGPYQSLLKKVQKQLK
jgi:hypothetical protein